MSNNLTEKVLLIGCGPMAISYAKVLQSLMIDYEVIGRGADSAASFMLSTGKEPFVGGIQSYFSNHTGGVSYAIIATGTEALADCLIVLISNKVKNVLIEKPGAVGVQELISLQDTVRPVANDILVAYNRRFYASVLEAERLVKDDGGIEAMFFEFTEWTHKIDPCKKRDIVLQNWFLANSSHVVDLAFFLAGRPLQWSAFSKQGNIHWHPRSVYCGSGITEKGILFSYLSHWESAGRWGIELLTSKRKILLKPLEEISVQTRGKLTVEAHEFDDELDRLFKPGIYRQTQAFLSGDKSRFINIDQQINMAKEIYAVMLA